MEEAGIEVAITQVGDRYVIDEMLRARLGARRRAVRPHHRHRLRRHRRRDRRGADDDARARRAPTSPTPCRWRSCRRRWSTSRSPTARRSPTPPRSGRRSSARTRRLEGRGRVLLRPSGTEPLVRVMVEAPSAEEAEAVCERLVAVVRARAGLSRARRPLPLLAFMCGIVGYVGGRPCEELLVAGLEKLEYRGYDSAGVSVIEDGEVDSVHAVGNLANLRAAVEERAANGAGALPPSTHRHRPHPLGHPRPRHRGERPPARRQLRQGPHRPQRDRREPRRAAPAAAGRGRGVHLRDRRRGRRPPDRRTTTTATSPPPSAPPSPSCAATTPSSPCTPTSPSGWSAPARSARWSPGSARGRPSSPRRSPPSSPTPGSRCRSKTTRSSRSTPAGCGSPTPRATRSSARPKR